MWAKKDDKLIIASSIPVIPTAILENMDSEVEKVELTFFKYGRWKTIIVPRSTIASSTSIVKLSDSGIEVTSENAKHLIKYLADIINTNMDTIPHNLSKSVMGWVDDKFLPYDKSIAFDGDDNFKHMYKDFKCKGKLEEWTDFVKAIRENLEARLCIASSFASPLIELIGENPFVFHLHGGTGSGKTVAMLIAMSVWGDPSVGHLTRTMNMTANSMLSTAAFLRNLPFAGDELQTIKNRWSSYDNLIMCITEGIDRGRMSFDKVNETKSWKCSFIFTGEDPCIKANSGGGTKNRVIQVDCDNKHLIAEGTGNTVANFARTHYGCAGEVYINAVRKYDVSKIYSNYVEQLLACTDTTDKQAGSMAIILAADKIATETFWPEQPLLTADDVKQYLFTQHEVDVSERAYSFIVDTIAENQANFDGSGKLIWGCRGDDERIVFFINKSLNKIMKDEDFDLEAVKGRWKEKGYIIPYHNGQLRYPKRVGGVMCSCTCLKLPSEDDLSKRNDTPQELPF